MTIPRVVGLALVTLATLSLAPVTASAQVVPPKLPPVVVDLRGFWSGLGQDPFTASQLGLLQSDLPSRGFGIVAGVHVYPLRRERFAFGIGGEAIRARGSKTPFTPEDSEEPPDPTVRQRLDGLTAQISLNFGTGNGWSYLTGGMGPMRFDTYLGDTAPAEASQGKAMLNMGGGARWFPKRHVAVTFDLRFYLMRPEEQTALYPGRQRARLMILSAGVAFK
jgi:hypothetical protein